MAHKKGAGSSRNGRESRSQRLGLKKHHNEKVLAGNIIVRQRGHKYKIKGEHVGMGRDHTIFALENGVVWFGKKKQGTYVSVIPHQGNS